MRKPAVSAGHHVLLAQQEGMPVDSQERQAIVDAADLLGQLLLQDVERGGTGDDADADADGGVSLKDGVSKDRWCRCMVP